MFGRKLILSIVTLVLYLSILGPLTIAQTSEFEANMALVDRFVDEIWHERDIEQAILNVDDIFAEDFVWHDILTPQVQDLDDLRLFFRNVKTTFPDVYAPPYTLFAEDDLVVALYSFEGTFTEPYLGIPPTGEKVIVNGINLWRIADGKIAEFWFHYDSLGLMQQLGAFPAESLDHFAHLDTVIDINFDMDVDLEANKALVEQLAEAFNAHDLDAYDNVLAEDFVLHDLSRPMAPIAINRDETKGFYSAFYGGFPQDARVEDNQFFAYGDLVAHRFRGRGTFTGEFLGMSGNGNEVDTLGLNLFRVRDGMLVEGWQNLDNFTMMMQILAEDKEEIKAGHPAAQYIYDAINDPSVLANVEQFISPEFTYVNAGLENPYGAGIEGFKTWVTLLREILPDSEITVLSEVSGDDLYAIRWLWRGIHSGTYEDPLFGVVEPTGNELVLEGTYFVRIIDDKAVEGWNYFDWISWYVQVGVMTLPPS